MSKDELVLVTQNEHKLRELRPIFREYHVHFTTSGLEKMEIRSDSIEEIAEAAAEHAFNTVKTRVVVDDTGLYITSLKGFPKSYPAFVLETIGRMGILKLLESESDRSAHFATAVGYCDGTTTRSFVGEMRGSISYEEKGDEGFGYDPIFVPEGYNLTYAQLSFEEKTSISHRTRAFRKFLQWYSTQS